MTRHSQVTDEMVERAMSAHREASLIRNRRDPQAAMRAALEAALLRIRRTVIPHDGKTHPCDCGEGKYSVWDGDGWLRRLVVIDDNAVDVDCSGTTDECRHCGRDLVPGQRERQLVRLCVDTKHPLDPGNYTGPIHCSAHPAGHACVTALYERQPGTTMTAEERARA